MARRRSGPRWAGQAGVLLLAGTAQATALSLSSLETISPAPLSCFLAYNAPMLDCTIADFSRKTCSRLCLESVDGVQTTIRSICGGIVASQNSLLSRAQSGSLVFFLCGKGEFGAKATSTILVRPSPSNTARPSSSPSASTTPLGSVRGTGTSAAVPFSTPPTTSTTSSASTMFFNNTTPSVSTTSSISSAFLSNSTSSISTMPLAGIAAQPSSSSLAPVQATPSSPQPPAGSDTSTASVSQQPTLAPGSGGGSSFDFAAASTAPALMKHFAALRIVAGWAVVGLLVQ